MRSNKAPSLVIAVLISVCAVSSTFAQFQQGDILLALVRDVPFPTSGMTSHLYVYAPNGALKSQILEEPRHFITDMTSFGPNLYAADGHICRIASDGTRTCNATPLYSLSTLVFSRNGLIYAAGGQHLDTFNINLTHLSSTTLPESLNKLDLAADQCTLVYPIGFEIHRYDVCTSTALPPVPTNLPSGATVIRILADGSMLADTVFDGIFHIDAGGDVLRGYGADVGGILALELDRTSFWTGNRDMLRKFDIVSGATLATIPLALPSDLVPVALTVIGQPRAALEATGDVPALSTWALVAIAVSLMLFGILRLRSF